MKKQQSQKTIDKNHESVNLLLKACEGYEKHLKKQTGVKDHMENSHKKFRSDRSYCNAMNYRAVIALKWILQTKHAPQEKLRHFAAAFAEFETRFSIKSTKENDKASKKFLDAVKLLIPYINHTHAVSGSNKAWLQLGREKKYHGLNLSVYDRRGAH